MSGVWTREVSAVAEAEAEVLRWERLVREAPGGRGTRLRRRLREAEEARDCARAALPPARKEI